MDWTLAISRNRDALLIIIADLFALAGMRGNVPERLSRHAYHAICHVLKAAEAAVRRLIFLAARGLTVTPRAPRAAPVGLPCVRDAQRMPTFNLIDPLKQFDPAAGHADISASFYFIIPNSTALPALSVLAAPTELQSLALCYRLLAIRAALENLPKQARRLARWQARHRLILKTRPCRISPFQPGLPPGYRARATYEVDPILLECHRLVRDFTHQPNSS